MSQRQQKAWWSKIETFLSFLSTVIGALLGRGVTKGTITQTGTSLRRATQIGKDSQNATQAEQDVASFQQQLQELEAERDSEIRALTASAGPDSIKMDTILVRPRKSDISVDKIALVWWAKN